MNKKDDFKTRLDEVKKYKSPKRKKRKQPKDVIQYHHIRYPNHPDGELVVPVFQTEHWLITQLQRFGSLTKTAKQSIQYLLHEKPDRPI